MALVDFQRALAHMALDPRLTTAVRQQGGVALQAYALTEREQLRLVAVSRQAGMSVTCTLARANRFGPIHDAFPMTCIIVEAQLRSLLDELWQQHPPDNYQLAGEEAAFVAFIEAKIASGALAAEYLVEIFHYEKTCWSVAMQLRTGDLVGQEGQTWVIPFQHDPGILFAALDRLEAPPAGLPVREYQVRLSLTNGDLVTEWENALARRGVEGEAGVRGGGRTIDEEQAKK